MTLDHPSKVRRPSQEEGFLALALLMGVSLLALLSLATWRVIMGSSATVSTTIDSDRAYFRATASLIDQLALPRITATTSPHLESRSAQASMRSFSIESTVDLLVGPTIDLDSVLIPSTGCAESRQAQGDRSFNGEPLSRGSMRSLTTCILRSALLAESTAFPVNGFIPEAVELPRPGTHQPYTRLSVAGFLETVAPLRVTGDALIIAGGDILLHSIESLTPVVLTLVSATGAIVVRDASPFVSVRTLAPRTVSLPPGVRSAVNAPPPPLLTSLVLGFSRGRR
jgi:hypothetical protein